ncbi:hypothetical protein ACJX0J_015389, partial [Zea mays]
MTWIKILDAPQLAAEAVQHMPMIIRIERLSKSLPNLSSCQGLKIPYATSGHNKHPHALILGSIIKIAWHSLKMCQDTTQLVWENSGTMIKHITTHERTYTCHKQLQVPVEGEGGDDVKIICIHIVISYIWVEARTQVRALTII